MKLFKVGDYICDAKGQTYEVVGIHPNDIDYPYIVKDDTYGTVRLYAQSKEATELQKALC